MHHRVDEWCRGAPWFGEVRGERVVIRAMGEADIDAVADLAQSARLLEASWQPQLWSPSSRARGVHPLVLRRQLDAGLPALIDEAPDGTLVGAVVPAEPMGCNGPESAAPWLVDDFYVATPLLWRTTGRALLIALAARAASAGVERLVVSCGGTDAALAEVLAGAGLRKTGWVRVRTITTPRAAVPVGVRSVVDADHDQVSHLLAGAARHHHTVRTTAPVDVGSIALALDDGDGPIGVAVIDSSVPAPPGHEPQLGTTLAEPIVLAPSADWTEDGARLVRGIEWLATSRHDEQVVIPCGPGESAMDEELGSAGYIVPLEWWTLDVGGGGCPPSARP
jgi:hypothetical protein